MADQDNSVEPEVAVPPQDDHSEDGLVLRWRRRGDSIEGLLTREVDGRVSTEWLPAIVLSDSGEHAT